MPCSVNYCTGYNVTAWNPLHLNVVCLIKRSNLPLPRHWVFFVWSAQPMEETSCFWNSKKQTELLKCLFSVLLKMCLSCQWSSFLWPQVACGKDRLSLQFNVALKPYGLTDEWVIESCQFTPLEGYVLSLYCVNPVVFFLGMGKNCCSRMARVQLLVIR